MDTIIYHANCCWDGFCSAWLCRFAWPNAEFIPANYGWTPPDVTGKRVLIVDFSYKREVLLKLKEQATSLEVLDHHETAERELEGLDFCTFDLNRSGAGLTWDYLKERGLLPLEGGSGMHWLPAYIQDRDLWRHQLPNAREVNAAIRSYPLDWKVWDGLAAKVLSHLVIEGTAVVRYQAEVIANHLKHLDDIVIGEHRGKGCMCSFGKLWSELMHEMLDQNPEIEFALTWVNTQDGVRLYSIRSRQDGPHVGKLAESLGGGGHKHSAGFNFHYELRVIGPNAPVHTTPKKSDDKRPRTGGPSPTESAVRPGGDGPPVPNSQ